MLTSRLSILVALCVCFVFQASAVVRYVDVSGNLPFAYTNIQDAVDASANGDLIFVESGVYNSPGRTSPDGITNILVVTNAITLLSTNGQAVLDGGRAARCVYLANGASMSDFIFTNGAASGNGGGVCCASASDCIYNSIITDNSASYGGGIFSGTLINCTLIGNSSSSGSGAYSSTLDNCIIYYNTGGSDTYNCTMNYCCSPGASGPGNTSLPPSFASAGDYHLQAGSPCINAGSNGYVISAFDLDGNLRIVAGTVDMGAYEYHTANPLLVSIQANYPNVVVGYPVTFTGSYNGGKSNVWKFADGSFATNVMIASHSWNTIGDYQVALTLYDDNYPSGSTGYFTVHVIQPPSAYVNPSSAQPVPPYSSWATAATNIQDAVDAANPGYHIFVTNGIFQFGGRVVYGSLSNRLAITKPVMIQSVNGPSVTAIVGNTTLNPSAVRCVYATNGAILSGFTLANGCTRFTGADPYKEESGGAIWCESSNVVITNCVLLTNSAALFGGAAFRGTLNNCSIIGNIAYRSGGACFSNVLNDCFVSSNQVTTSIYNPDDTTSGGGLESCAASSCILAGNMAQSGNYNHDPGGGANNSQLFSCIISNNTAQGDGGGAANSALQNCTLTGNHAAIGGGGASTSALLNCIIIGNAAANGAGLNIGAATNCVLQQNIAGAYAGGAAGTFLYDCLITGNSGWVGGGAAFGATLVNCTVSENSASSEGGGIDSCIAENSIIVSNTAPNYTNYDVGASALNYCCTFPLPPDGVGNIATDPDFIQFHLAPGSPCIDAGTNDYATGLMDLDGNPRLSGGAVDMGPFEFQSQTYFDQQPQTRIAYIGQTIALHASVVSAFPTSYQWQLNGTNVIGATNSTLVFTNIQFADQGVYDLLASNAAQVVSSSKALLTVYYTPLIIFTQPADDTIIQGSNAVFAVDAYSPYPTYFQWQCDGTNISDDGRISGSTGLNLSIANSQLSDAGNYQLLLTNQYASVTSSIVSLTVLGKPVFLIQPSDFVADDLSSVNFSATVQAAPPITVQWQRAGTNLVNSPTVAGADTTSLTLANLTTTDSSQFVLVVSNSFGVTTSATVNLTVVPFVQWGLLVTPPPPTATNLVEVAAGSDNYPDFNAALRADGTVLGWGGILNSSNVPPDATNVVTIAAGDEFGLALRRDGTIIGWGDGSFGETTPPPEATNIVAIAGGHDHSLALKADGTVIAWGYNSEGQTTVPTGLTNVIAISAGNDFSVALKSDGSVVAWGYNYNGESTPPSNASNIVAIYSGGDHTLALKPDGTVIEWGNVDGGRDMVPDYATNLIAIAAGDAFGTGLRGDGTVTFWGESVLGSGSIPSYLTNVVALSAKKYQNIALIQDPTTHVAPSIWRQPGSCTIPSGQTEILLPMVFGSGPMRYQWLFNGARLVDETNNWLALVAVNTNQAGNYQFVATNNYGSVTSQVAVVSETIGIAAQPISQVVFLSNDVSIAAAATGFGPFGYQWLFNNAPLMDSSHIVGSTSNTLSIANVQFSDAGSYSVIMTNSDSSATTQPGLLNVVSPPSAQQALIGTNVLLSVTNVGPIGVLYQWLRDGNVLGNGGRINGANTSSLMISGAQPADTAAYQIIVTPTNTLIPNTSSVASVTIMLPADITSQPQSQAAVIGSTVEFSVGTSGTYLGYQWFKNGVPIADDRHFIGSSTPSLTISDIQPDDAAGYVLLVSNALSSTTSLAASLTPLATLSPSVRYVNVNSTNPIPPYLDWGTAATNIQDAIDAAVTGDFITVTDGVYQVGGRVVYGSLTNRVAIDKDITVQSINGAATTIIRGNQVLGINAVRCAYLTNNAILNGFTLMGGATLTTGDTNKEQSGGGAWCESTNAELVDCLIVSNVAWLNGGGQCFGTLSNCVLTRNIATNTSAGFGGGSYFGVLNNCVLSNNTVAVGGGGAYSNVLNNCLLSWNAATNQSVNTFGGGAELSILNNCTITNNSSGNANGGGVEYSILRNCLVISNFSKFNGGGGDSSIFVNCSLMQNRAVNVGGGANASALYNCLVAFNHANGSGGGVYSSALTSCTVAGNSAGLGGSSTVGGVAFGTAKNSIIYTNVGVNTASTFSTNCCTIPIPFPPYNGGGNITGAPLFLQDNSDFHLQSNSPCINSGNNAFTTNSVDLDGNPRITGNVVDIGAYEYQNPASVISYAWLQQYGLPTDGSADYQDTDGNGMNNWQKWIAGLNPTNASSVLMMMNPSNAAGGGITLVWQSVNTRTYYLQRGTNSDGPTDFSVIQSNIVGRIGTTGYTDRSATNAGPYFYRVGVQ